MTHSRYSVTTCDWKLHGDTVKFIRKTDFLSVGPEDDLALDGTDQQA